MTTAQPEKHVLEGFPETALNFFRALEQRRRAIAAERGLSEIELRALFLIAGGDAVTPKRLSADLGLTNGAITGISSRLVAAGHVRRLNHPNDRRSLHLELTESGHEAMRQMHQEFRNMLSPDGTTVVEAHIVVASAVLDSMTEQVRALTE